MNLSNFTNEYMTTDAINSVVMEQKYEKKMIKATKNISGIKTLIQCKNLSKNIVEELMVEIKNIPDLKFRAKLLREYREANTGDKFRQYCYKYQKVLNLQITE